VEWTSNGDDHSGPVIGIKRFADQLRNIAPVFTLIALVVFFASRATLSSLDNMLNIRQLSSPASSPWAHLRDPHRRDRSLGGCGRQRGRHHRGYFTISPTM
jgi:hypothetical protein